jgi:hypothetical protein
MNAPSKALTAQLYHNYVFDSSLSLDESAPDHPCLRLGCPIGSQLGSHILAAAIRGPQLLAVEPGSELRVFQFLSRLRSMPSSASSAVCTILFTRVVIATPSALARKYSFETSSRFNCGEYHLVI